MKKFISIMLSMFMVLSSATFFAEEFNDEYEEGATSEILNLTAKENNSPVVAITNYIDGDKVKMEDFNTVSVSAEDTDDNIKEISLYINDTLVEKKTVSGTNESADFNLSDKYAGDISVKAVATDNYDAEGITEIHLNVEAIIENTEATQEFKFDGYTGSSGSPTGSGQKKGGSSVDVGEFVSAEFDEEHGESMGLAVKPEALKGGAGPWFGFGNPAAGTFITKGIFDFKFDMRCDKTLAGVVINSQDRINSIGNTIIYIENGIMKFYNNGAVADTITIDPNKWYTIEFIENCITDTVTIKVNEGKSDEKIISDLELKKKIDAVSDIRFTVGGYDDATAEKNTFYIDNIEIHAYDNITKMPSIELNIDEGTNIKQGKTGRITGITDSENIKKVEFYIDSELVKEFDTPDYVYDFTFDEVKPYTIYAKIYDKYGFVGTSQAIDVNVIEAPRVTISLDKKYVKPDAKIKFTTDVVSAKEITKVEYYVNDVLADTKETAPYTCEYTPTALGINTVYAKAYDEIGIDNVSDTMTFTVQENQAPTIDIGTKEMFSIDNLSAFEVYVNDIDGSVANVNLKAEGKDAKYIGKSENGAYLFNIERNVIGNLNIEITAVDDEGKTASLEKKLKVKASDINTITKDFSESQGFPTGSLNSDKEAAFVTVSIDKEHGKSFGLKVGNSTPQTYAGPWVGLSGNSKSSMSFSTEIYCDNTIKYASFNITDRTGVKGIAFSPFGIKEGVFSINDKGASAKSIPLENGKWYSIDFEMYFPTRTYTVILNKGKSDEVKMTGLVCTDLVNAFSDIRIVVGGGADYTLVTDNVELSYETDRPYITEITGESSMVDNSIKYTDKSFKVKFDQNISVPSAELVTLSNKNGNAEIASIEVDKTSPDTLIVTPKYFENSGFDSAETYTVKIDKESELAGSAIGYDIVSEFTTTSADIDVISINITDETNNVVTAKLRNNTQDEFKGKLVVMLYNGNEFVSAKTLDINLENAPLGQNFSLPMGATEANITVKAFVTDLSLIPLTNKMLIK